jgi:glycosyltransferase involved in cell wall biosynthesis
MRILKVWDAEYPWDVRAEKVCRGLSSHGHVVHMVARNRDGRAIREVREECVVHRMSPWSFLPAPLDRASQFPAFFNPRWLLHMLGVARSERVDLILVRDLPLAPTAIYAGRRLGLPVVLDMAENYPAMMRDLWTTGSTRFGDSLVRNPRVVAAVERWVLARVDHVLVVVEESGERLMRELGVPPRRITVVGNTPSRARLEDPVAATETPSPGHPLRLVYLGLLEHARGVGTAIESVRECRERGVPVSLTVVGDGRAREDLEALVARLSLSDEVTMTGFLPHDEALSIVRTCQVGLIPHLANESWHTTIPNKLFDYMAAGLAVVTSDARPAMRVVEAEACGLSFRSGDPASLADALERLWRSGAAAEYGLRGRQAVRARFNWEEDERRLLDALTGALGSGCEEAR